MMLPSANDPPQISQPPSVSGMLPVLAVIIGAGGFLLALLLVTLVALTEWSSSMSILPPEGGVLLVSMLAVGLLGLGLAWAGVRRQMGMLLPPLQVRRWWWWLIVLAVPAWLCGVVTVIQGGIPTLVFAVAHVITLGTPALLIVAWGLGGKPGFSALRTWMHLIGGAWGGLMLSLAGELLLIVGVIVIMVGVMAVVPDVFGPLADFATSSQPPSPAMLEQMTLEILGNPLVIGGVWFVLAVCIPVIEELFKPLGMWLTLLVGHPVDRRSAFLGGMLGGVGFGLIEGWFNALSMEATWGLVVMLRFGALGMHSLASGIMGYGLGEVRRTGRPMAWLKYYLGAIAVHGAWNTMVVVIVAAAAFIMGDVSNPFVLPVGGGMVLAGGAGLFLLLVGSLGMLFWWGRHLAGRTGAEVEGVVEEQIVDADV